MKSKTYGLLNLPTVHLVTSQRIDLSRAAACGNSWSYSACSRWVTCKQQVHNCLVFNSTAIEGLCAILHTQYRFQASNQELIHRFSFFFTFFECGKITLWHYRGSKSETYSPCFLWCCKRLVRRGAHEIDASDEAWHLWCYSCDDIPRI